jgi:hypothetical protein
MAIHEGCRRLHKAGKSLGLAGLTLLVLATIASYLLTETFFRLSPTILHVLVSFFFYVGWIATIIGGLLWLIGWICEGFALPRSTESDRLR